jgi:hypothetical protein
MLMIVQWRSYPRLDCWQLRLLRIPFGWFYTRGVRRRLGDPFRAAYECRRHSIRRHTYIQRYCQFSSLSPYSRNERMLLYRIWCSASLQYRLMSSTSVRGPFRIYTRGWSR